MDHVRRVIASLKQAREQDAIPRIPVPGERAVVAYLRPVPRAAGERAEGDARLMAEWRNLHRTAFFTWFTATPESTARWLRESYATDGRDIIFMVETPERVAFGHLALYNFSRSGETCEYGRVVRAPGLGPRGGMSLGSIALLRWAASELKVERFFLEVFSHNATAIGFYERLGFVAAGTVPLRRSDASGVTRWLRIERPGIAADGYALRMEAGADRFAG